MAFTDPISITVNAVARSMPRVETSGRKSVYQSADGLWNVTITQIPAKNGGSRKALFAFTQKVQATDPFNAEKSAFKSNGVSVMLDIPDYGFTSTTIDQQVQGMFAYLATAKITQLVGGES
jgi:hypothetical protein